MDKNQFIWYPTINYGYITKDMWKYIYNIQHRMIKYNLVDTDISYMINRLFNYKVKSTNRNCGGYCSYSTQTIAVHKEDYSPDKLLKFKHTIAHEVGHVIQAEVEYFEKEELLLSNRYYLELQAESLGNILFDIMFPNDKKDIKKFDNYFHKKAIVFLRDYYGGGVQNDLEYEIDNWII